MPFPRAPLTALALVLGLVWAPASQAASTIVLEAPNGLTTLAITAAPGGGFALVGQELVPYTSEGVGGTDGRLHIYRYEGDGKQRWKRTIDRRGPQIAKAITYGPGEVLYVAGLDGSALSKDGYQSMLAAFGPRGNVIEDRTFGKPFPVEDFLTGVAMAPSGDLVAAGRVKMTPEGSSDMEVMGLTTSGQVRWNALTKNGSKESYPVVSSGPTGIFVAGTFENRRVFVSRIDDATGSVNSFASFSTERRCAVAQMLTLSDGGVVLGINLSHGNNAARLVRVGGNGSVMWDVKVPGQSVIADMTLMPNGLVVVAGTSDDPQTLASGAWLKAYDEGGNLIGEILPDTTSETHAGGVTRDGADGVFFAYSPTDESIPAKPSPIIVERIRVD